jgi:NAD(P)-dependent dehydrogenase (short-subunit alcohol dehydrogenase family)
MAAHAAKRRIGVIGTYHTNRGQADALVAEINAADGPPAALLQLDVARSDTFADFAGTLKATLRQTVDRDDCDYLIHNTGIGVNVSYMDTTEEQFADLVRIQLKAPFFLSQTLLPIIADGGLILNVSSGLARFTNAGYSAYAATKGGIEVLIRYMALELSPQMIRVNVLAPGAIETDFAGGGTRQQAGQRPSRRHHRASPSRPPR